MLLCTIWDENIYYIVNRKLNQVQFKIQHPRGDFKCWGMKAMPNFDLVEFPYILTRDDQGMNLLDLKKNKAITIANTNGAISSNLFGHGNILQIVDNSNFTN